MAAAPQKKTSALKIVLIVLAVLVGLGVLGAAICIGSGYFWFQANAPELMQGAEQARSEAETFAATATQTDCVDEGFRRHDTCGAGMALSCRTSARIFTDVCLDRATPVAGFCDGVPGATEIMAGATWAASYCADQGRGQDQHCGNFVRSIVEHCAHPGIR